MQERKEKTTQIPQWKPQGSTDPAALPVHKEET